MSIIIHLPSFPLSLVQVSTIEDNRSVSCSGHTACLYNMIVGDYHFTILKPTISSYLHQVPQIRSMIASHVLAIIILYYPPVPVDQGSVCSDGMITINIQNMHTEYMVSQSL